MEEFMFEELENFLSGTFHQDIDSPESAIKEFVFEADREFILRTISNINQF